MRSFESTVRHPKFKVRGGPLYNNRNFDFGYFINSHLIEHFQNQDLVFKIRICFCISCFNFECIEPRANHILVRCCEILVSEVKCKNKSNTQTTHESDSDDSSVQTFVLFLISADSDVVGFASPDENNCYQRLNQRIAILGTPHRNQTFPRQVGPQILPK